MKFTKLLILKIEVVILIIALAFLIASCKTSSKGFYSDPKSEFFYYQDTNIYHVSARSDTTLLDWGDIRILGIDSLKRQYLYFKAEKLNKVIMGKKSKKDKFKWFENTLPQPNILENDLRFATLPVKVMFKWERVVTDYDEETGYTEYGEAWVMHVLPQKIVYHGEQTVYLASIQNS